MQSISSTEPLEQFVVFRLENEQYGVGIAHVREIVKWSKVTKIPQISDSICGITNLRGQVIPIVSLRRCFGLQDYPCITNTKIVITEVKESLVGLVVDTVEEVVSLDDSTIQEPPPEITSFQIAIVYGIAKTEQGLIILLDPANMFSSTECQGFEQISSEAQE